MYWERGGYSRGSFTAARMADYAVRVFMFDEARDPSGQFCMENPPEVVTPCKVQGDASVPFENVGDLQFPMPSPALVQAFYRSLPFVYNEIGAQLNLGYARVRSAQSPFVIAQRSVGERMRSPLVVNAGGVSDVAITVVLAVVSGTFVIARVVFFATWSTARRRVEQKTRAGLLSQVRPDDVGLLKGVFLERSVGPTMARMRETADVVKSSVTPKPKEQPSKAAVVVFALVLALGNLLAAFAKIAFNISIFLASYSLILPETRLDQVLDALPQWTGLPALVGLFSSFTLTYSISFPARFVRFASCASSDALLRLGVVTSAFLLVRAITRNDLMLFVSVTMGRLFVREGSMFKKTMSTSFKDLAVGWIFYLQQVTILLFFNTLRDLSLDNPVLAGRLGVGLGELQLACDGRRAGSMVDLSIVTMLDNSLGVILPVFFYISFVFQLRPGSGGRLIKSVRRWTPSVDGFVTVMGVLLQSILGVASTTVYLMFGIWDETVLQLFRIRERAAEFAGVGVADPTLRAQIAEPYVEAIIGLTSKNAMLFMLAFPLGAIPAKFTEASGTSPLYLSRGVNGVTPVGKRIARFLLRNGALILTLLVVFRPSAWVALVLILCTIAMVFIESWWQFRDKKGGAKSEEGDKKGGAKAEEGDEMKPIAAESLDATSSVSDLVAKGDAGVAAE